MAFCVLTGLLLLFPAELKLLGSAVLATSGSAMNVYALKKLDYFAAPAEHNPLLMAWSLGVEEQFYIAIPALMQCLAYFALPKGPAAFKKTVLSFVAIGSALSLLLSIIGLHHFRNASFYLLPMRAWELGAGVWMAAYEAELPDRTSLHYGGPRTVQIRGILGLGAVLCAIVLYGPTTPFPGVCALLPVVGTMLILSAPEAWLNRSLLSWRPIRAIGLVSYSWYLWHWPLLSFARICSNRPLSVGVGVLLILLALALAAMTYHFVEQPFRRAQTPQRHLLLRYAAGVTAFALLGFGLRQSSGLPGRFHLPASAFSTPQPGPLTCFASLYQDGPITTPPCVPAVDGRPTLALVGDSHAHALAPFLGALAETSGYRFVQFARGQCPPLRGYFDDRGDPEEDELCLKTRRTCSTGSASTGPCGP